MNALPSILFLDTGLPLQLHQSQKYVYHFPLMVAYHSTTFSYCCFLTHIVAGVNPCFCHYCR